MAKTVVPCTRSKGATRADWAAGATPLSGRNRCRRSANDGPGSAPGASGGSGCSDSEARLAISVRDARLLDIGERSEELFDAGELTRRDAEHALEIAVQVHHPALLRRRHRQVLEAGLVEAALRAF